MSKRLWEMCGQIVAAQASAGVMSTEEIEESLRRIYKVLQELAAVEEVAPGTEQVQEMAKSIASNKPAALGKGPYESIGENSVVCLECGAQFRQITANHLKSHGMTPREYKKKWGFRLKDSLAAKVVTRARSEAAKVRGIPENLKIYQERRRKKSS
ncbi:MucR family transcriptional regulator [Desulfosoma caldarium]|uniref:MucR family transcriptional regulator n=1 Tax=Desulfosoma caldarium TaxID=610254 RepID=A0A3N1VLP9_9BACT|nr:MucR family transcriptional regulator [Desulfosoma caldarium]ROR02969.1 MucR family transcriptional regulator [Desulfosoma caldarium]